MIARSPRACNIRIQCALGLDATQMLIPVRIRVGINENARDIKCLHVLLLDQ